MSTPNTPADPHTAIILTPADNDPQVVQLTNYDASPSELSLATWSSTIEWLDPRVLTDHALWAELLGAETPANEQNLARAVHEPGAMHVLTITGEGCASGVDVILDGHRFRRAAVVAGLSLVPCIRRVRLTADGEEIVMVKSALASQHTRKLTHSQLAALERRLYDVYRRTRGNRTDLTSVATNGSPHPDTLAIIARETGQPRNQIANRLKLSSPVAPQTLGADVDAGSVTLTRAAAEVRATEACPEVKEILGRAGDEGWSPAQLAQHPVIANARTLTQQRIANGGVRHGPRQARMSETVDLMGVQEEGIIRAEGLFAHRRVRVEISGLLVRLTQLPNASSNVVPPSRVIEPVVEDAAQHDVAENGDNDSAIAIPDSLPTNESLSDEAFF